MRTTLILLWLCSAIFAQETLPEGKLIVTVSVDWEGRSVDDENVSAMVRLRERFPKVPYTQFLNAGYYTHEDAEAEQIDQRIRKTMLDADEIGLHIHCWKSLIEASGVTYRDRPTFWGRPAVSRRGREPGHEVELDAYELDEIGKVVRFSKTKLKERGFELSQSFRCPGWCASEKILHAVRAEGFRIDSSATDATWHQEELDGLPIHGRIRELWPKITPLSQPYEIETPAGAILEMPDTGALADYVTGEEMIAHLESCLESLPEDEVRFAHIGFHHETAARYGPRLEECLTKLAGDERLMFVTLEQAARIFRKASAKVEVGR
ncbi:MAG: hypothetical protein RL885_17460 [Planctomycetota bacterium]